MRALLSLTLLALLAGCATTSSGGPLFRLRPKGDPVTGAPATGYSGNVDILITFPEFDDVGGVEFKSPESAGIRVSARPVSWYIAPEIGYLNTEESKDFVDLNADEIFGGGRIAARFEELPIEFYGSGGYSYLESDAGGVDDETSGFYVGGGVYLYLGSNGGFTLGLGYRLVEQDWDLEEYGEFQVHAGLAW
jgi:hypothetical protein